MAYSLPIDTGSPLYAIKLTEAVLNTSWDLAGSIKTDMQTAIANAGSSFIDPDNPPEMIAATVSAATVTEPSVSIPAAVDLTTIIADFDDEQTVLVNSLVAQFSSFRSTYFPSEGGVYSTAEGWLQDAMTDPSVGMPAAVASQIWDDDRSRILSDAARATADALGTFAGRRYPLPPGAAAAAVLEIQQKAQEEIASSGRKVAMASVDQMRFAVQQALGLRQVAMSAALDYVKTMAFGMDMAAKVVDGGYGAQSQLISAAASLFNARTHAKDLEFKGAQMNAQFEQEASKANLQSASATIEMRLKSLLQEAETLGRIAQALYNNLHASAGASASFQESQAT